MMSCDDADSHAIILMMEGIGAVMRTAVVLGADVCRLLGGRHGTEHLHGSSHLIVTPPWKLVLSPSFYR